MTETPARKARPRRTFSAFGDVRRMPSEYEIVTQGQNWTLRQNRAATFEQNPSSAANLWFLTYRDNSPLKAENWDAFRDPAALTYRSYVTMQSDAETKMHGVLEAHADQGADEGLDPRSVALLGTLDDVLLTQLGQVAKSNQDDLTWLLTSLLAEDSRRRGRWSRALAALAVAQRPDNRAVFGKWISRWSGLADDAALGLGTILEGVQDGGVSAADVAGHVGRARGDFLTGLLDGPGEDGAAGPG